MSGVDGGLVIHAGSSQIALSSGVGVAIHASTAWSSFPMEAGETIGFCLNWAPAESQPLTPRSSLSVDDRIADTVDASRSWEPEHDIHAGCHRELVRFSSRGLKRLSYRLTVAIVAAPTTSLPEEVGGGRDWDCRYSWIRDASLTLQALYAGACPDAAADFFRS